MSARNPSPSSSGGDGGLDPGGRAPARAHAPVGGVGGDDDGPRVAGRGDVRRDLRLYLGGHLFAASIPPIVQVQVGHVPVDLRDEIVGRAGRGGLDRDDQLVGRGAADQGSPEDGDDSDQLFDDSCVDQGSPRRAILAQTMAGGPVGAPICGYAPRP